MDSSLFKEVDANEIKDPITGAPHYLNIARILDEKDFSLAKEKIEDIIKYDIPLDVTQKNLLKIDLMFIYALNNEKEKINQIKNKELDNYFKILSTFPNVIRTNYALHTLIDVDKEKAKKDLELFNKVAKDYPYPMDIEAERENIKLIDNISETKSLEDKDALTL